MIFGIVNYWGTNRIGRLVFIVDKGITWSQYLQVSIINITEEDFNTIRKAIQS